MGQEPGLGEPPKHRWARGGGPELSEPVTESSGLLAHICRLCGSHNHPFPLTASQTIKEPPSPSSCFLGRSGCLVMILEGEVFFCLHSLVLPKEHKTEANEQESPGLPNYNIHLILLVSESWDPPTSECKSPEEQPRTLNFKQVKRSL